MSGGGRPTDRPTARTDSGREKDPKRKTEEKLCLGEGWLAGWLAERREGRERTEREREREGIHWKTMVTERNNRQEEEKLAKAAAKSTISIGIY